MNDEQLTISDIEKS